MYPEQPVGGQIPYSGPPNPVPQPGPTPPYGTAGTPISAVPYAVPAGYSTQPFAPPQPFIPPPVRPPGQRAFVILCVAAAGLAVALLVTAGLGWSSVSHLRQQRSTRQAARDALVRQADEAATKQRDDFRNAGFEAKLQHIKDLDKATDTALAGWHAGTTKYGVLAKAIQDCDDAVDDYDRAAAPFPDNLFGGLPKQINLSNPETDCGRAFVNQI
jgi:hypothetical protein